jgi:hypothetical protein
MINVTKMMAAAFDDGNQQDRRSNAFMDSQFSVQL